MEDVLESKNGMTAVDVDFQPFKEGAFTAEKPKAEMAAPDLTQQKAAADTQQQAATTAVDAPKIPEVDYNKYLKENFGYDTPELLKADIEKGKAAPKEREFENEQSRKYYELAKNNKEDDILSFLTTKKTIDRLTSVKPESLTVDVAAEIIKAEMRSNPDFANLEQKDIDRLYAKQFGVPNAPKQYADETQEEFDERTAEWVAAKEDAEQEILLRAKIAQPKLEKLKSELKLPDIEKPSVDAEAIQKDLEAQAEVERKDREFEAKIPDVIKAMSGVELETTVKYGDVDLPIKVSYIPSDAERQSAQGSSAKSMEFLRERWFDAEGNADPLKVAKDIFTLQNMAAIQQKIATESATQAVMGYINKRGNVNIDNGRTAVVNPDGTADPDAMAKFFLKGGQQ